MNRILNEEFAGRIEFLLSADEKKLRLSQDARQELLRKFREMIEMIRKLEKENQRLKEDLKKVRDDYEEYRHRHPETVGVKNGKAYAIPENAKDEGEGGNGTGRKPGAQPGHKPFFREKPAPDWTEELPVDVCPDCGSGELGAPSLRARTVEGITLPVHFAVEYLIQRRWCGTCRTFVESDVPDVLPNSRIDLRTMLVMTYMRIALRLPVQSVAEAMQRLFSFHVSEGEIIGVERKLAEAFTDYYEQLLGDIRNAPVRHMDETTWRVDGENSWLWAFVTKWTVVYAIRKSRSHEVPLNILAEHVAGINITDRYRAYDTLAAKTGDLQSYCWSHVLGDAKELMEFYGEEGKRIHDTLHSIHEDAAKLKHMGNEYDVEAFVSRLKTLDVPYKSAQCARFVKNVIKDREKLFLFVELDIESTNNRAERAIRPVVISRKISGGSHSDSGATMFEKLASIVQTMKLRDLNSLTDGMRILRTSHG